jgi:hypothetical protein
LCNGAPVPIVRNESGQWIADPTASFAVADVTLDLRRYAKLPNEGTRPSAVMGLLSIGGDDRRFVVTTGPGSALYAIAADGSSVSKIFTPRPPGHRALLDVEFHPDFYRVGEPGYGKLYTTSSLSKPTNPEEHNYIGTSAPAFADGVLMEWNATFDSEGAFSGVEADSYRELFRVATYRVDHPIGNARFNPFAQPGDDDYGVLYISHGDSYQFGGGNFAAQDGTTGLGKILRINPLQQGDDPYAIPSSNPFLDDPSVADEIYTLGHRNNHNFSFARDHEGGVHILVAEIGESSAEEINLISQGGGNYGWSDYDGTIAFPAGTSGADPADFTFPIAQYGHNGTGRHAVAGGFVVGNGSELDGRYFFADFATSGAAFTFDFEDGLSAVTTGAHSEIDPVDISLINVRFDHDDDPLTPLVASSLADVIKNDTGYDGSGRLDIRFGQGPRGAIYVLNKRNGWVYQVMNSIATTPADFDYDRDVDEFDLEVWANSVGISDGGDANGDGITDGSDFLIWQRSLGAINEAAPVTVPGPTGWIIFGVMSPAVMIVRRRSDPLAV